MNRIRARVGAVALVVVLGGGLIPVAASAQEKGRYTEEELARMITVQPAAFEKLTSLGKEMDEEVLRALQQDEELYVALVEGQQRYLKTKDPKERKALLVAAQEKHAGRYMAALEKSGVDLQVWAGRIAEVVNAAQATLVVVRVEQGVMYIEPAKPAEPPRSDPPPAAPSSRTIPASDYYDDPPEVNCGLGAGGRYRLTPTSVETSAISGFLGGCSSKGYKVARPAPRSSAFSLSSTADLRVHGTLWGGTGGASCVATASHSFFERLEKTPWAAVLFPAWFDEALVGTKRTVNQTKPTASFYSYTFSVTALGGADCYSEVTNISGTTS